MTEGNLASKAGAFLRFWLHSIRQAFNYGWGFFGAMANVLPVVVAIIQRHTSWNNVAPVQWVGTNWAEAQVICFLASSLVYLLYAPYKQFRITKESLSSQITALQKDKQDLIVNHQSEAANHQTEVAKLRSEIESLNHAASDTSRKDFDIKFNKTLLGNLLMELEDQESAVKKIFHYSYDEAAQKKANEERAELLNRIIDFLDKYVGRDAAAMFRGARGSPTPVEGPWDIFTDKTNAKRAMVADLEAHYVELKKILEKL